MIESLYVLTSTGDTVLQKHWRGVVHRTAKDTFVEALTKASSPQSILPVISTPKYYLIHIQRDGLYFLTTVTREVQPLLIIEFLNRFLDILGDYFKNMHEDTLKDNFVTVFQLLDEMMDNGFPHTTEPNILREIIPPPSVAGKIFHTITGQSSVADVLPAGSLTNVPWRKSGVKYSNNEIYFDFVESIDAIIDSNGLVVSSEVGGVINVNCKLSGMPDLTLQFTNARMLDDTSFHPCVRYNRYERERVVSFVPPDGNFRLMTYRIGQIQSIPVYVKPSISWSNTSGTLNITVGTKNNLGKQVDDVVITIPFPPSVSSSSLSANVGTVNYDPSSKKCVWTMSKLPKDKLPQLSGTISLVSADTPPPAALDIQAHFAIGMFLCSGLKVDKLTLVNEKYKLFKGIRLSTKAGRFHVRL